MNEIRDLIVGIDFGREYSQICYYDRKGEEPRSLSMKVGGSQYEAPTCLCRRTEQKDYCVGLEAEYFAREKGGIMIHDLYGICEKKDSVVVEGQEYEPWELLAEFMKGILKFLGITELVKNTKCIVVTLEESGKYPGGEFSKRRFRPWDFRKENICFRIMGKAFIIMRFSQEAGNLGTQMLAFG